MKKKTLGNTNVNVSAIGLGCMGMSDFYGSTDEKESISTLHRAQQVYPWPLAQHHKHEA